MFKLQDIDIVENLYLGKKINDTTNWELDFFDREGYQLNTLEKLYHIENKVDIYTQDRMARRVSNDALNAVMQHWYIQNQEHPNIFIDHAHILHRFAFEGEALNQLVEMSEQYPKLQKMIKIKPKYGLDFAIDWIDENQIIEMFHVELDCRDYSTFVDIVDKLQTFIETTDWENKGRELVARKSEWVGLDEYKQSAYKAKLYGLDQIGVEYLTEHYLNKPYLFTYLKVIE